MCKCNVWFQKIAIPPPRRELEIPRRWGWGGGEYRGPGNSRVEWGWTIKITFQGVKFELSTKIGTY